jgi:hypothetical protein
MTLEKSGEWEDAAAPFELRPVAVRRGVAGVFAAALCVAVTFREFAAVSCALAGFLLALALAAVRMTFFATGFFSELPFCWSAIALPSRAEPIVTFFARML